jgi:sulfite reductase (NADPH) flavoprotein alpha-component
MISSSAGCIQGSIVDRYCLNKPSSSRETWHIVIDITGSHVPFRPGDSIGVWPKNPSQTVSELVAYFHLHPATPITDPRTKQILPLFTYLEDVVDLNRVSSRLVDLLQETATSHEDRQGICSARAANEHFEGYDVPHLLRTYAPHGVDLRDIAAGLLPITPRLYSISSGPTIGAHRIELTVARVHYECHGRPHLGLCSNYLVSSPLYVSSLRLFHQPSKYFSFPSSSDIPLVMVGAGTGVAPFRAFMQEVEVGAISPPPCWLFFGERRRTTDFFYKDFWDAQVSAGRLRLDLAFSQDQEQKIYVQHRMWERRAELWQWIDDGAVVLVCGNAKTMAKDVDACLATIAASEGGLSPEKSLHFLRDLRHQGRYVRDVY